MRRNRRGNFNNSGGPGGPGPLMTGHLQDIDLELELLKRKREMIEQQQQLLAMEQQYQSRHSYDQMRYDEPDHHGSNRDFTHLYEPGPKQRNQYGKKRPAEHPWQYEGSPKRSPPKKKSYPHYGSSNNGPSNFRNQRPMSGSNQGSKYSPRAPAPLMDVKIKQSIGQKIASQKAAPKTSQKNFAPSKVSKPKPAAPPNKLASKSVTERKSLVDAAMSSDGDVSRMLLPDRVPTQQVSGRLELALGAIMKNIRTLIEGQPQKAPLLRSIQLQRVMKQTVRERIRTVMLGKVVGSLIEILAIYREEFPEETDIDILNIALEAGGIPASELKLTTNFIKADEPEKFFKTNMTCLLEAKLTEYFSKLQDMYKNAPSDTEEIIDLHKIDNEIKEATSKEAYKEFMNTTIKVYDVKKVLPTLLRKYIPYIVKLLSVDTMYQNTKAALTIKTNKKATAVFNKATIDITHSKKVTVEAGQGDANAPAEAASDGTPQTSSGSRIYNLPYYAKIMGRPTLPKRKVMHAFLSQFNPKSIKKHRTIHNLLFVGFNEKSDFEAMVGADGTILGRTTISVRICSKVTTESTEKNGVNNDNSVANNDTNDTGDANNANQDENIQEQQKDCIISNDLEGQITDLLTAIRKSEEEDNNDDDNVMQAPNDENKSDESKTEHEQGDIQNDQEIDDNTDNGESKIVDEIKSTTENTAEIMNGTEENETKGETVSNGNIENLEESNTAVDDEVPDKIGNLNSEPANETDIQNTEASDEIKTEIVEDADNTPKSEVENSETENSDVANQNLQENIKEETQTESEQKSETETPTKTEEHTEDKVGELKSTAANGRSTPTRMSARRAATPSSIRTRRASRLTQN